MKLRIIGDTHGEIELLMKEHNCDYTLVLGDFGVSGRNLTKLNKHLKETNNKVLFVDGNHEYFNKLKRLPELEMFGGKVGKYAENIFWLKRGEVYEVEGKSILTFGGAFSVDRVYRTEGVDWFPEEQFSSLEFENLSNNIEKYNNKFDYIFTHDCPEHIVRYIHGFNSYKNKTSDLLENIYKTCEFEKWYFGHHHVDFKKDKFTGVWEREVILDI